MLSEILVHESNRDNHRFIQAEASVFEAVEIFKAAVTAMSLLKVE